MTLVTDEDWPAIGEATLDTQGAVALARLLGALADPIRLRLISIIAERGPTCACDLVGPLERSQPTISHHTKVLANVGLLRGTKDGRSIWWSADRNRLAIVIKALGNP